MMVIWSYVNEDVDLDTYIRKTPLLGCKFLDEANDPFDRAAGEVLRCDFGHLILSRNMVEGDFTVPDQFLQEEESESDTCDPCTVGEVADDVEGANVVPEK